MSTTTTKRRKKIGRPKMKPEDRQTKSVLLRLTQAEHELLMLASDGKPCVFVREAVLRAARRAARS